MTDMTNGKFSNEAAHCYADRQHGHVTTQGDAIIYAIERIVELEDALRRLAYKAQECDGWESFPSDYIDDALSALGDNND